MMESADAIDDSDDEADYTKMDQGNKKGPVGRWDFDTQEEYSSYMSSREALPKSVLSLCVSVLCSSFFLVNLSCGKVVEMQDSGLRGCCFDPSLGCSLLPPSSPQ